VTALHQRYSDTFILTDRIEQRKKKNETETTLRRTVAEIGPL